MSPRWMVAVLVLVFLFVLMPFLFWQATWFGKPLSDEQMGQHLADLEHPRKTQHALSLVADRIVSGDPQVKRWYPQVVSLANHQVGEIRTTVAWVMGQDNSVAEFHQVLLVLLRDPNPMVRRNAALSLVRFRDDSGHAEIVGLLRPFSIASPASGPLEHRLEPGNTVNPGTMLGRVQSATGDVEVRSIVPGRLARWLVPEGAQVSSGQPIAELDPGAEQVWEALRALVLVGRAEDLTDVEPYARGVAGMPEAMRQQARETVLAIKSR